MCVHIIEVDVDILNKFYLFKLLNMAESMANDLGITESYRQSVRAKIDEATQISGMLSSKNSTEMENDIYQKAKSKEEYLGFVARIINYVKEMSNAS